MNLRIGNNVNINFDKFCALNHYLPGNCDDK